jgi:hypothetical protein
MLLCANVRVHDDPSKRQISPPEVVITRCEYCVNAIPDTCALVGLKVGRVKAVHVLPPLSDSSATRPATRLAGPVATAYEEPWTATLVMVVVKAEYTLVQVAPPSSVL